MIDDSQPVSQNDFFQISKVNTNFCCEIDNLHVVRLIKDQYCYAVTFYSYNFCYEIKFTRMFKLAYRSNIPQVLS